MMKVRPSLECFKVVWVCASKRDGQGNDAMRVTREVIDIILAIRNRYCVRNTLCGKQGNVTRQLVAVCFKVCIAS